MGCTWKSICMFNTITVWDWPLHRRAPTNKWELTITTEIRTKSVTQLCWFREIIKQIVTFQGRNGTGNWKIVPTADSVCSVQESEMWVYLPHIEYCSGLLCSHPPLSCLHRRWSAVFQEQLCIYIWKYEFGQFSSYQSCKGSFWFHMLISRARYWLKVVSVLILVSSWFWHQISVFNFLSDRNWRDLRNKQLQLIFKISVKISLII